MDTALAQATQSDRTAPLNPPAGGPENSIKQMAVLFTDIVASTKFFQVFGDVAGRKMLKEHEEIASPPILEHGGVIVKMLGDSLMAYFFNPWEAVKAAIKIQNRLQAFNKGKRPEENIHVRIGVHFGEGILEEEDIFGDVVNLAAKFLPFVNGDEVGISPAVFEQIQVNSTLRFESVSIPDVVNFPQGFHIYKVKWGASVDLKPLTKTLLLFRPLFALGKATFRKYWERLLNETNRVFLAEAIEKEAVLEDQSLAIIVKDPLNSLSAAKNVTDYLQLNLGMDVQLFLPLQILIDIGPFLRGNKVDLDELRVRWEDMEPGRVYVSAPAYHILKSRGAFQGNLLPGENPQPFYQVPSGKDRGRENCLFLYQNAMTQGDFPPCFYCGDRKHPATHCPSKRMTEATNAIGKMGYLPLEQVNRLFFDCLNKNGFAGGPHHGDGADINSPSFWAYYSFYELKSVYQLRLFRAVWNATEEDWNKIKEGRGERNYGGLAWIAQDCIRVSNLDQAESILKESLVKEPDDFKPLCAMGFLHVERDNLGQAKFYFKRALDRCQTMPQKIMLLFLLSRVYQLQGDFGRAEETIRRIVRHSPYCAEALYEDVLLQFRKGKEGIALHQLMKLIKKNREYFVNALIDPELAKYREVIHPKIKALLNETRQEANKLVQTAREELVDLKKWLGDDEPETKDAEALLSKIGELSKVNSFFSHTDILQYANNLVGIGRSTLEERRRRIARVLRELARRHEKCSRYVKNFPYRFLVTSLSQELGALHPRISTRWGGEDSGGPTKFKDILQETERISAELSDIETRLQRMEVVRKLLLFSSRFLKRTLIFQSANLAVAIILFPIVTYYLNLLIPALNIASYNIWLYQKSVLSLGSISGLLLALLTSGGDSGTRQTARK